jgi:hypothetical protein
MHEKELLELKRAIDSVLKGGGSTLDDVSRTFATAFFRQLRESLVLVRTFVTLEYKDLPVRTRAFADGLAESAHLILGPRSVILTLLGSAGVLEAWNDPSLSRRHAAIPMASSKLVEGTPMLSALLEQLGFDLGWFKGEGGIVAEALGKLAGTFYVEDASTSRNSKGELIIPAQDFVAEHHVGTVFGFGGGYPGTNYFTVTILFLNEHVPKETALFFQGFLLEYKTATKQFIAQASRTKPFVAA